MIPLLTHAEPHPDHPGKWRWVIEWVDPDGVAHRLNGVHPTSLAHAKRLAGRQADALPTHPVELL